MLRLLLRDRRAVPYKQIFKPFSSEKSVENVAKTSASAAPEPEEQSVFRRMHSPSDFDKRMMVWVGRYKTIEEVPRSIPVETLDRSKNKARIKVCNYMILATILGCCYMAWSGKQAAQRGESVHQMNVDWHKAVKEGRA